MYTKSVIGNGLRVFVAPMKGTKAATVLILVGVGSRYESKQVNGITHFLEHMFFKGSLKRPRAKDISEAIDRVGGELNGYTSEESTGFYAHLDSSHLELSLDVLSDMLLEPRFGEEEIEKEKGVIREEINMHQDRPDVQAVNLFKSLLYGDHPLGWEVLGRKEVIDRVKREDLVKYWEDNFVSNNAVVVIAGDVDCSRTLSLVESYLGTWRSKEKNSFLPVKERQFSPNCQIKQRETDLAYMCLGVRTFSYHHPDYYALRVLNTILGGMVSSRLFVRLREEEGVAYSIDSVPESYTDTGNLCVHAEVEIEKVHSSIRAIIEEFRKIREEGVEEEELRRAKDYLKGRLALELEVSPGMASFLGHQELLLGRIRLPEEQIEEWEKVSREDIQRLSSEIFVEQNMNLAIVGPFAEDKRDEFAELLKP